MKRSIIYAIILISISGLLSSSALTDQPPRHQSLSLDYCCGYVSTNGLEWHFNLNAYYFDNMDKIALLQPTVVFYWYYDRAHPGTFTQWATTTSGWSSPTTSESWTPIDANLNEVVNCYVVCNGIQSNTVTLSKALLF